MLCSARVVKEKETGLALASLVSKRDVDVKSEHRAEMQSMREDLSEAHCVKRGD